MCIVRGTESWTLQLNWSSQDISKKLWSSRMCDMWRVMCCVWSVICDGVFGMYDVWLKVSWYTPITSFSQEDLKIHNTNSNFLIWMCDAWSWIYESRGDQKHPIWVVSRFYSDISKWTTGGSHMYTISCKTSYAVCHLKLKYMSPKNINRNTQSKIMK